MNVKIEDVKNVHPLWHVRKHPFCYEAPHCRQLYPYDNSINIIAPTDVEGTIYKPYSIINFNLVVKDIISVPPTVATKINRLCDFYDTIIKYANSSELCYKHEAMSLLGKTNTLSSNQDKLLTSIWPSAAKNIRGRIWENLLQSK